MGESGIRESFFTNVNGKKIFCRYWCDDVINPRALVLISHGAGEHCLWYTPLAILLKEAGCYVFAHDHVGHGQSEGDRLHVDDFHEYVRDVFQHFDTIAELFPGLPKYAIGHSMGGAITIIAAIERPDYFDGIVLIAPAVVPDPTLATPLKIFCGKIVARICPQAPVIYLNPEHISRDEAVVQRYKDDPLVYHGGLKARWGATFLEWLEWIKNNMHGVKCPLLTVHGTEDRLAHCDGSRLLADKVSSSDKMLKIYSGFYHQLHYEPGEDGAEVRNLVVNWITSRLQSP